MRYKAGVSVVLFQVSQSNSEFLNFLSETFYSYLFGKSLLPERKKIRHNGEVFNFPMLQPGNITTWVSPTKLALLT